MLSLALAYILMFYIMSDTGTNKPNALGFKFAKQLNIGDLVTWKDLGKESKKKFGVIKEIYTKIRGSRPVAYARVFLLNNETFIQEEVLIIRLKLLSKRQKRN